jgi:hypothetical protein
LKNAGNPCKDAGTLLAISAVVIFRFSCRAFLIAAASVACASKLHAHNSVTPGLASQELTRCLSVVRAAARTGGTSGVTGRRATSPILLRPLT